MPVIVNDFEALPEPPPVAPPAPRPAERSATERRCQWHEARAARVREC